jgi:hypothetical protein
MRPGGARDERVRGMDRPPAPRECRLVATRSDGSLASRIQKPEATQEVRDRFPFLRPNAPLDLGDVDTTRPKRMPIPQEIEQEVGSRLVTTQVGDENGRVEQIETQAGDSVRRVFRTQAPVARWSRQCRYGRPRAMPAVASSDSASASCSSFSFAASSRKRLRPRLPATLSTASSTSSDMTTCVRATTTSDKSHLSSHSSSSPFHTRSLASV